MVDMAFAEAPTSAAVKTVTETVSNMSLDGTLYVGYPILKSVDGVKKIDALLTSRQHGIVAFDLSAHSASGGEIDVHDVEETQDEIYVGLVNKLQQHRALRKGRKLAFEINVVTLLPEELDMEPSETVLIATPGTLRATIEQFEELPDALVQPLNAVIQRTTAMRPRKRRAKVSNDRSRGAILKNIEKEIANLDAWQKKAAIEYPEGPQRIRGLAGSGKTIVLAQKASFLHVQHPDWTIAITFHTRSLYQQFRSLIRRFSYELIGDEPDWDQLKVLHSWGSSSSSGVYYEIARSMALEPRDYGYAKSRYGYDQAFAGVCREILASSKKELTTPIYDAVLVDEAQDFPAEFFQIIYHATHKPKRIVWAYDELQNLGDYAMSPAGTLFGEDDNGKPRVSLENRSGQPQQDIILPICYRNTQWALLVAHALGFGVYRDGGLVQMFDEPALWDQIGYELKSGALKPGKEVSLERKPDASPRYFSELLKPDDAVICKVFESFTAECEWVAMQIAQNIGNDELDYDDILIVHADPLSTKKAAGTIMKTLKAVNIDAHLVGVTTSRDALFYDNSIAITSIYRAKGNEAPMVYVMGSETCLRGFELAKKRNILFTAITRSRGWVRVSGSGQAMDELKREFDEVIKHDYRLEFTYPTTAENQRMRQIHRDMPKDEKRAIEKDIEGLGRLASRIEKGELDINSLPDKVRELLSSIGKRQ